MKSKVFVLFISLLLLVSNSFCQKGKWEKLYTSADSLAKASNFILSQNLLDSILNDINQNNISLPILELKTKSLKGYCYERQEKMDKAFSYVLYCIEEGKKLKQHDIVGFNYIQLALLNEKIGDLDKCFEDLNFSKKYISKHSLNHLKPTLYIRHSSYFRFVKEQDSIFKYATLALNEGRKYNDQVITDAFMLLSGYYYLSNPTLSQNYLEKAKNRFLEVKEYDGAGWMFLNISDYYLNKNDLDSAMFYVDSGLFYSKKSDIGVNAFFYECKSNLYEKMNKLDSAMFYLKLYTKTYTEEISDKQGIEINEIKAKYKSQKKDEIIAAEKEKNETQYWMMLGSFIVIGLIGIISFFLFSTNKKLKHSNSIINKKTEELIQSVEQKELLLSEIHHRVKNNLQTIIGILGLQTNSSVDKSLEEITLETQDRVKSMATLHNKVYEKNGNLIIDFDEYLKEITQSLIKSHVIETNNIIFEIAAPAIKLSIDQSIPLGLIIVELVNNSFKYAFNNINQGIIKIELIQKNEENHKFQFIYEDNGIGFDENRQNKGMGHGIIHGLVKQLKGKIIYTTKVGIYVDIKF